MNLDHLDLVNGASYLAVVWNVYDSTLYDNLDNLSEEMIDESFRNSLLEINAFEKYIMSKISDYPKDWDEFINAILAEIPTAFGKQS